MSEIGQIFKHKRFVFFDGELIPVRTAGDELTPGVQVVILEDAVEAVRAATEHASDRLGRPQTDPGSAAAAVSVGDGQVVVERKHWRSLGMGRVSDEGGESDG